MSLQVQGSWNAFLINLFYRYPHLFGSDDRMHACMAELGIPLTKEPGFHQVCFHLFNFRLSGVSESVRCLLISTRFLISSEMKKLQPFGT